MTKKKKPKLVAANYIVYANRVNLSGLYSQVPLKCVANKSGDDWSGDEGEFCVNTLGESTTYGSTTFVSNSENEVEMWTKGVQAAMFHISKWATAHAET